MLCSIPTGKSGSKWLDRLRSSKGFPAAQNDLDLDQFLSNSNPPDPDIGPESEIPVPNRNQTTPEAHRENGEREWLGLMSNVLSELFNMGEKPDDLTRGKKCSRKQPNPRVCAISTSSNVETVPSSGENSCADVKERSERLRAAREENADFEEDEDCYDDLSGFSRTEVTVIDSSCASWKNEKLLFRRKNMWRVREKKSRSVRVGAKKRKGRPLEEESGGGEKKQKRCDLSKDGVDGESRTVMPSSNQEMCDHFCCVWLGVDIVSPKNSSLLELAHVDAMAFYFPILSSCSLQSNFLAELHLKFKLLVVDSNAIKLQIVLRGWLNKSALFYDQSSKSPTEVLVQCDKTNEGRTDTPDIVRQVDLL
ncbi:hypothetical protein RHSIM_Rhsim03G0215300 [Rhododendron simsii]|uniref:Uncharacterized protein n=1 Tax=Rhododendron simsii TaxID=118357 RepID=A0A834LWM4_RHOSS|nr:hypothetical protein RHSIM_Rhsim03G0215300 [Rhododendron simsii]